MGSDRLKKFQDELDPILVRLYGCTWDALGNTTEELGERWLQSGVMSPKEFALWYGERYHLDLLEGRGDDDTDTVAEAT